jgi:hypothetical protein
MDAPIGPVEPPLSYDERAELAREQERAHHRCNLRWMIGELYAEAKWLREDAASTSLWEGSAAILLGVAEDRERQAEALQRELTTGGIHD